ncbi:MAG: hypothetical protein V7782_03625 [Psychromonas sp.]
MLNIKFYNSLEEVPRHGQSIVYISASSSEQMTLKETIVEYMWIQVNPVDGVPTGVSHVYDFKQPEPYDDSDHFRKRIRLGVEEPVQYLWIPTDELYKQFKNIFPDDT